MNLDKEVIDYINSKNISSEKKVRAEKMIRDNFKNYSGEVRELVKKVLKEYAETGKLQESDTYQLLINHDYIGEIPTPKEFIDDPYYMGRYTGNLYPKNREMLLEILDPENCIHEVLMTGSIGFGKTLCSTLILLFKLVQLSRYRDPAEYFGLMKDSQIVFGVFSVHKYKSSSIETDIRVFTDGSPFFQESFPRSKYHKKALKYPNNISFIVGAHEVAVIGENVYSFLMDEVNFMQETKDMSKKDQERFLGQAQNLYTSTTTRIKSRFHEAGRESPGIVLAISSKTTETAWLERHIKDVQGQKGVYVRCAAIYDVKPEKYSNEYFYVLVGDRFTDSRILADDEIAPKDAKIVKVPEDFREDFEKDPDRALREISGISTMSINPLFKRREKLVKMFKPERVYPFTKNVISISTESNVELIDLLDLKKLVKVISGSYAPIIRPSAKRLIHVDLSKTGCSTGFCMGHVYMDYEKNLQHLDIDIALEIIPPEKGEVDFEKIRNFIINLNDMGFVLGAISYDGYQSSDSIQRLIQYFGPTEKDCKDKGLYIEELSVDRDDRAYLYAKELIDTDCCTCYYYQSLLDELIAVQHDQDKKKVIKGESGELKDIADAFAGVAFHAMEKDNILYRSR